MNLSSIDDPRKPWDKFRRSNLVRICRDNGIQVEEYKPATLMRELLVSEGVNPAKYMQYADLGPLSNLQARQPVVNEKEPDSNEPNGGSKDMSFMEFKAFAKKVGVKVEKTDTMESLNTKLRDYYSGDTA